jgi:hypothetical protein
VGGARAAGDEYAGHPHIHARSAAACRAAGQGADCAFVAAGDAVVTRHFARIRMKLSLQIASR